MRDKDRDVWSSDGGNWRPNFQGRGMAGDFGCGKVADEKEIRRAWRNGRWRHWGAIPKLHPDILISVNHNWYIPHQNAGDAFLLGEYADQINGGMLEEVMVPDDGSKLSKGWSRLYGACWWSCRYVVEPVVLVFTVSGPRRPVGQQISVVVHR